MRCCIAKKLGLTNKLFFFLPILLICKIPNWNMHNKLGILGFRSNDNSTIDENPIFNWANINNLRFKIPNLGLEYALQIGDFGILE